MLFTLGLTGKFATGCLDQEHGHPGIDVGIRIQSHCNRPARVEAFRNGHNSCRCLVSIRFIDSVHDLSLTNEISHSFFLILLYCIDVTEFSGAIPPHPVMAII